MMHAYNNGSCKSFSTTGLAASHISPAGRCEEDSRRSHVIGRLLQKRAHVGHLVQAR